MKHKFLTALLSLVAAFCLCFGIAACGIGGGNGGGGGYEVVTEVGTEGLQYEKRGDKKSGEYFAVTGLGTAEGVDIVIPSAYDGLPVKEIGESAFNASENARCASIKSISIPSSVTTIGDRAFYECSGLTGQLIIPNGVARIGSFAFWFCSGLTGELKIPNSVSVIGWYAFYECTGLESVTFGSGLTAIGTEAFYHCSGLKGDVIIPDRVTEIGERAFQDCAIESVTIGSGVTKIGYWAFRRCSALTSATFRNPNGWSIDYFVKVDKADLQNPTTAAAYLLEEHYWTKD